MLTTASTMSSAAVATHFLIAPVASVVARSSAVSIPMITSPKTVNTIPYAISETSQRRTKRQKWAPAPEKKRRIEKRGSSAAKTSIMPPAKSTFTTKYRTPTTSSRIPTSIATDANEVPANCSFTRSISQATSSLSASRARAARLFLAVCVITTKMGTAAGVATMMLVTTSSRIIFQLRLARATPARSELIISSPHSAEEPDCLQGRLQQEKRTGCPAQSAFGAGGVAPAVVSQIGIQQNLPARVELNHLYFRRSSELELLPSVRDRPGVGSHAFVCVVLNAVLD